MGFHWSLQLLWVPVLILLLLLLTTGLAFLFACANLFFRDVKYLVQVFLTFGIFITPVILNATEFGPKWSRVMMLNPVAPILEGLRLTIVEHHNLLLPMNAPAGFLFWRPWYLAYAAAWAFGGLVFSAIVFHRSERHFAEVV